MLRGVERRKRKYLGKHKKYILKISQHATEQSRRNLIKEPFQAITPISPNYFAKLIEIRRDCDELPTQETFELYASEVYEKSRSRLTLRTVWGYWNTVNVCVQFTMTVQYEKERDGHFTRERFYD